MFQQLPTSYRFALYVRKSSESEDRQVLSIESQINHLEDYAQKQRFHITHIYEDSASAHKVNNRPQFTQMCLDIHAKKFDGILCWKADRLARNPVEGGQIIYALQTGALKIIATPYQTYFPENNTLPLTIEFGMANQYSLDLSKNIKRGNRTKIEKGGWCRRAPIGYLNDRINKTIIKDPERFEYVKKMFEYYLTSTYSVRDICTIANKKWNFKTLQRPKSGGIPLQMGTLYKMLKNPFYAGWVCASGITAKGNHKAMISQTDFDKIQHLLARKTTNNYLRLHAQELPYKTLMTCGECGSAITAQKKTKYKCPKCKKQHCSRNPKTCSCGHMMTAKTVQNGNHYHYYNCTKQKGKSQPNWKKCNQPYVSHAVIEQQMQDYIKQITPFHEPFIKWLAENIAQQQSFWKQEQVKEKEILLEQKNKLTKKAEILLQLTLDGGLSSKEYKAEKFALEQEKQRIKSQIQKAQKPTFCPNVENICNQLKTLGEAFKNLPGMKKKQVLKKLASNCILQDKKLVIEWHPIIQTLLDLQLVYEGCFEPLLCGSVRSLNNTSHHQKYTWWSKIKQLGKQIKDFEFPDF